MFVQFAAACRMVRVGWKKGRFYPSDAPASHENVGWDADTAIASKR
jgi:hypothetical protein